MTVTETEMLNARIRALELLLSGKTFFDVREELTRVTAELNAANARIELLETKNTSLKAMIRNQQLLHSRSG